MKKKLYINIANLNKYLETFWQSKYEFSILSYHLNNKIKELQRILSDLPVSSIKINGEIYDKQSNKFITIYSDLICLEKHNLN